MPRHVQQLNHPRRPTPPPAATSEAQLPKRMDVTDIDSLLDEIDLILEEEDEFLVRYRAKPGQ